MTSEKAAEAAGEAVRQLSPIIAEMLEAGLTFVVQPCAHSRGYSLDCSPMVKITTKSEGRHAERMEEQFGDRIRELCPGIELDIVDFGQAFD